ncbi:MAG: Fe2+-dependent dioxygenase [Asticcacaulis sp.]
MMLHVPHVLTRDQVDQMRARLDRADWQDGRATVGAQGAGVKNNRQLPENGPLALELGALVLAALKASDLFFSAALPKRIVPPLFNRYEGGETYGLHVDGAMRPVAEGWLRTDLSCTLFLSDPEDYDGGDLEVVDTYGLHDVKLPAGDLILYPSTSLHQVTPVTRGARICSFFWLQSLIRDNAQRQMLFDLDMTIRRLRAQMGDTPEVLSLTAHYHNLMRQWAEA